MSHVEIWANAIMTRLPELSLDAAAEMDSEHDDFYTFAIFIVEPIIKDQEAMAAYCDFVEYNADNWAQWIRQTCGDSWGLLAKVVAEEGY